MQAELGALLLAGTDTTSSSLCSTPTFLAKHPQVQERAYEEIAEHRRDGVCRQRHNERARNNHFQITVQPTEQLNYTEACAKELTRPEPQTAVLFVEESVCKETHLTRSAIGRTRTESTFIGSGANRQHVPEGVNVLVDVESLQRDKGIWGEDADFTCTAALRRMRYRFSLQSTNTHSGRSARRRRCCVPARIEPSHYTTSATAVALCAR